MNQNIPLYQQVFNKMKKHILDKKYLEGEKLPSEKELQSKFGVSRITVRRAMEMLQNEGYIEKYSGLGTIVKNNRQVINLRNTSGFSRDNRRYNATSKLVNFEVVSPSEKLQMNLELTSNDLVYKITRLRLVNEEIVGLHTSFVPVNIVELDDDFFDTPDSSLYAAFKENDVEIASADETIEIKNGNKDVNKLLEVSPKFPSLYIERTTFNEFNRPIEFVEIYYRTDRYKYQTKFHNFG